MKCNYTLQQKEEHHCSFFHNSPIALFEFDFSNIKLYFDKLKKNNNFDLEKYLNNQEVIKKCISMIVIIDCNIAAMQMYKANNINELSDNLDVIYCEESYAGLKSIFISFSKGATIFEIEIPNKSLVGEQIWISLKLAIAHDSKEDWRQVHAVSAEITERKWFEEELQKNASELREANAELSQYAYVVSHDIRTPLRAIGNYAGFLLDDLEGTLVDDQLEYLHGIGQAAKEANELVEDLLELSRIGRETASLESVDLKSFLQEHIAILGLPADITLTMPEEWPKIISNPVLLWQIYQNIIENAAKFNTSPKKTIELGWREMDKTGYEFFVRDNGLGIDKRHQEQIFRVFERLHTRSAYEGTGIGLAVVKKVAKKLKGSVWLESELGKGSTFFFMLPRNCSNKT